MTDALLFAVFAVMNGIVIILHRKKRAFDGFYVPVNVSNVPIPAVIGLVSSVGMLAFVESKALLYSIGFFVLLSVVLHWLRPKK